MLKIKTKDGIIHRFDLNNKPCPTTIHRLVSSSRGVVSILHKTGTTSFKTGDIVWADFSKENEPGESPWDYEDPLN